MAETRGTFGAGRPALSSPAAAGDARQDIEQLRRRYAALREKQITAQADLNNATKELERLKREARERHGTDDLTELTRMLEEMKRENERKRAEYQAHLDQVDQRLVEVEREFTKARGAGPA